MEGKEPERSFEGEPIPEGLQRIHDEPLLGMDELGKKEPEVDMRQLYYELHGNYPPTELTEAELRLAVSDNRGHFRKPDKERK